MPVSVEGDGVSLPELTLKAWLVKKCEAHTRWFLCILQAFIPLKYRPFPGNRLRKQFV